ncbi:alpha/beta fold hydrolase [Gluconacetobacter azotocaptans]|uniref:alpha/beta hydrolase n=1 Tax=Gluconacetobacter azotocaptans TaxID=142834 RepID=UPI00195917A0|nr:alpha/beta fold hydrolase [Gluconacetobacter azotocaptans]MBM9400016.1 alpha/beta fold hydrolase [Gluconacetobacter azotocaptans]
MKKFVMVVVSTMLIGGAAQAAAKPSIVLVHGAFEDANVWQGVAAGLRQGGYTTIAVDLPGRPSNPAAPTDTSLTVYRSAVLKVISSVRGPVVLVGHSFGGFVISDVA